MSDILASNINSNKTIESAKFVVLGNVDAGKSSFIGVLEKNVLDDGNGSARSAISNVKHELETGRTSTYSSHYLVSKFEDYTTVTTLIDLCGHQKYLKTTIFGIMGLFGDYGLVMIGANMGITNMTEEHIGLLVANRKPFYIVMTKIDICPDNVMSLVKKNLERLARRYHKQIVYFDTEEELVDGTYLKNIHYDIIQNFQKNNTTLLPIIMVSNKTGYNINFAKELITSTHSRTLMERTGHIIEEKTDTNHPTVMYIDRTYAVKGIGIVLSGTVKFGTITVGQKMFIGPINNTYQPITVRSIHNCLSQHVNTLMPDDSGSISFKIQGKAVYNRDMFSKGQVVTDDLDFAMRNTCYTFGADILIFRNPATISNGYQTTVHCVTVRQPVKFKLDDGVVLRSCDKKTTIAIKFLQRPEFMLPGNYFVFRDGHVRGMGKITSTIPFTQDVPEPQNKRRKYPRHLQIADRQHKILHATKTKQKNIK